MNGKSGGLLLIIGAPVAIIGLIIGLVLFGVGDQGAQAACNTGGAAGKVDPGAAGQHAAIDGYKLDQLTDAAYIMNAADAMGLDRQAMVIGVMTAMGESSLHNIDYGDNAINPDGSVADSIGLFQQQSSWGTTAQRMDPTTAATLFYKRMVTVKDWETTEPTLVAHAVQGNEDPFHYEQYQTPAQDVVSGLLAAGSNPTPSAIVTGAASTPAPSASGATSYAASGCNAGGTVLPLTAPFDRTSDYGPRNTGIPGASTWHPAYDLQTRVDGTSSGASGYSCGSSIFAAQPGTVTVAAGYQISIKSPAGYTITYMHMYPPDMKVHVGDQVTAGEAIAVTGMNGPASGCHLDIRINKTGSTDPAVSALPDAVSDGAPASDAGYVNPEDFFNLFGVTLCGDDCRKEDYGQE